MKKILLLSMLALSGLVYQSANAQVRVGINININSQPDWGPSGYDYVQYYYLPEVDMYYNVVSREYIYLDRGRWVNTCELPMRLRGFNFYNSYKVVINDRNPWLQNDRYRRQYANYRNRHDQMNWRDSRRSFDHGSLVRNDRRPDFQDRNDRYKRDNDQGWGNNKNDRGNRGRNDKDWRDNNDHNDNHERGNRGQRDNHRH